MISIVIPIHNEAANIISLIDLFINDMTSNDLGYEVILVENGSTDDTFHQSKLLVEKYGDLIKLHKIRKPSYGEAIKFGMQVSASNIVFVYELDFLNIDFIYKSLNEINLHDADVVIGSKLHPDSNDKRPIKRRLLTYLFNVFLKHYFGFKGTDTHGLKAFRRESFLNLDKYTITTDEVYQTELVMLANKLHMKVIEVPVDIHEMRNPSVSIFRRIPKIIKIVTQLQKSMNRDF